MSGEFEHEYPLFIIAERITVYKDPPSTAFHAIVTIEAENGARSLALFTNSPAAELFRDENVPDFEIFEVLSANGLLAILHAAKEKTNAVAFDPYRSDREIRTLLIEDLLRQLHIPPDSPA